MLGLAKYVVLLGFCIFGLILIGLLKRDKQR